MLEAVQILIEASIKLDCSASVRTRALILYHQFMRYTTPRPGLEHNDTMVAAAALKNASRYEEETIDYDTLVLIFYCIVNKTTKVLHPQHTTFLVMKSSLMTVDSIMQRKLTYTFCHRLAHQFLVPFLAFIFERNHKLAPFHVPVSHTSLRFANDLYTDSLSINFKPDHIAIACIHAALHIHGLLEEMEFLEPWFKGFSKDMTLSKLREIKIYIFNLYLEGRRKPNEEGRKKRKPETSAHTGPPTIEMQLEIWTERFRAARLAKRSKIEM